MTTLAIPKTNFCRRFDRFVSIDAEKVFLRQRVFVVDWADATERERESRRQRRRRGVSVGVGDDVDVGVVERRLVARSLLLGSANIFINDFLSFCGNLL